MNTFTYFAYGSNMLSRRLRARCPSAQVIGVGQVFGHVLEFSKRSADGSGKVTLVKSNAKDAQAYGVLFEIIVAEQAALDKAAGCGAGYRRDDGFCVAVADGRQGRQDVQASTYVATAVATDLPVYDWYRDLVLAGAREHKLPAEWIAALDGLAVIADPNPVRATRLEALAILEKQRAL
jgi:gamma-glutamylcyclotransferase